MEIHVNLQFLLFIGKNFITLFTEIKQTEHDAYQNVISAWEREHLLLFILWLLHGAHLHG